MPGRGIRDDQNSWIRYRIAGERIHAGGIADAYPWIDGDVVGMGGSVAGGRSTMRRLESAASAMRRSGWCLDRQATGGESQQSSLVCENQLIPQKKSAIFTDV